METTRICPSCKKPLAPNAPQGLCPECLLKIGLGSGVEIGPDTESASGRVTFVVPPVAEIARLFPQLEILNFIGQGGMGAVYRARQKELDRVVALKILPPDIGRDAAFAERFTREARAMAKLNHPGIVTLYEFGRADGLFFFLMEFVEGVNLGQLLAGGHLSSREALAIVPQICDALQYAHDQGIVHRDIKPQNILVDRRGRVKVADFGLAKLVGRDETAAPGGVAGRASLLTEAGRVMGTPQYMAPEQREHPTEVDHRADIYSLGVVFYQMLTGELPARPVEAPSHKVQVDIRLDDVVLRTLEKEPERRYQQASQVKTDVETIASTSSLTESESALDAQTQAQRRSRLHIKAAWFSFAAVCFLLAAVVEASNPLFSRGAALVVPVLSLVAAYGLSLVAYRNYRASAAAHQKPTPAPKAGSQAQPGIKPYPWETAMIGAGIAVFVLLIPLIRTMPPSGRVVLGVLVTLGLLICILSLSGVWPFPSVGVPDSGFSRRNLHHSAEVGWTAFICACLSGLIPTIFFWLAPWLVPGLTPQGQELMLWLGLGAALAAIFIGIGSRQTILGQSALAIGAINLSLCLLFGVAGVSPPQPMESTTSQRSAEGRAFGVGGADASHSRKFVRLVAGASALTFEGQRTNWDGLDALLAAVPDRPHTVLEFAVTSDQITVAQQNEWFQKASVLARQHGFEYASFIGVHPLGSQGKPGSPPLAAGAVTEAPPVIEARPGEYRVTDTNGADFEVVALTSSPRAGAVWWRPDGTLLDEPPGEPQLTYAKLCPSGRANVEFAVLTRGVLARPEYALAFEPRPQYVAWASLFKSNQFEADVALAGFRAAPEGGMICKAGSPNGPWERAAIWDPAGALLENNSGGPLQLFRSGADDESCLRLNHQIDRDRFLVRLAVRLKNGESKLARVWRVDLAGADRASICALTHGIVDTNIVAYELYRAPVRWVSIPAIATKPTVAPLPPLSFDSEDPAGQSQPSGPVRECELRTGLFDQENRVVDLDTGQVLSVPNEKSFYPLTNDVYVQNNPRVMLQWMVHTGADLLATDAGVNLNFHLDDGRLAAVTGPAELERVTVPELERSLGAPGVSQSVSVAKTNASKTLFAFKTREGGLGALQILKVTEQPPAIKLRYKLLRDAAKTNNSAVLSSPPATARLSQSEDQTNRSSL